MNNVSRIAEIMRRGAAAGQRRWRIRQLRARTGLAFSVVYRALIKLLKAGALDREGPEWIWRSDG